MSPTIRLRLLAKIAFIVELVALIVAPSRGSPEPSDALGGMPDVRKLSPTIVLPELCDYGGGSPADYGAGQGYRACWFIFPHKNYGSVFEFYAIQVNHSGSISDLPAGALYIGENDIAFQPFNGKGGSFDLTRSDVKNIYQGHGVFDPNFVVQASDGKKYLFSFQAYSKNDSLYGLAMFHPPAEKSLQLDPANWAQFAWTNFDDAVRRFMELTRTAPVEGVLDLSEQSKAQFYAAVASGDSDAALQQWSQALTDYMTALNALPPVWAPPNLDQGIRNRIVGAAAHLTPPPAVPTEAEQHEVFGKTAAQSATKPDDLFNAVDELRQAVRIAPWWADGYYNLAVVQEKAKLYGQAAQSLEYYLLAAPNASDAQAVQTKIYSLQYEATHQ